MDNVIELRSKKNRTYEVRLPASVSSRKSAYIFAYAKSGSTLLENMITTYCAGINASYFSLYGQAFAQGITTTEIDEDALCCFRRKGYIYGGFRHYPHFPLSIRDEPVVLLVRDPRDMLVSLYYSVAKSHVIPGDNAPLRKWRDATSKRSIDDFVLDSAVIYLNEFNAYKKALAGIKVARYRYEDVIYEKEPWLRDVVCVLGLYEDPDLIKKVARAFDIIPGEEGADRHIRQVHPGNHRLKLKEKTIKRLDEVLNSFLRENGYDSTAATDA